MYLLLSSSEGSPVISLEEPDDCSRFHLTIRGLTIDAVQQALARSELGHLNDAHTAWIRVTAVRELAQERIQSDWLKRFTDMLHYAERKGWLSEDGESIFVDIMRV